MTNHTACTETTRLVQKIPAEGIISYQVRIRLENKSDDLKKTQQDVKTEAHTTAVVSEGTMTDSKNSSTNGSDVERMNHPMDE